MANQNQVEARYHSTQAELYPICYLGWGLAKKHQADVALIFPEYTVIYIDGKIAAIQAAEELPDFQTRDSITETDRIKLKQLSEIATDKWKLIERYIIRALQSNKPLIKPAIEAAGKQYYESATKTDPNWEDVKRLLVDGKKFLADPDNALLLAPVMPVGFPTEFNTAKDNFETKYGATMADRLGAPEETAAKLNANNAIYDDLMLLIDDLKEVAPVPARKNLSFTHFKGIISSPGPAGLKGKITEQGTGTLLAGVLCRLLENGKETTTDALGEYDFGNFASGKFTLELSLDGYVTLTVPVEIFTGVTSTKNFQLKKNP